MNQRYRKTIIAGNWKMNKTPAEAKQLIENLKPLVSKAKWCEVVLCVPFVDIPSQERLLAVGGVGDAMASEAVLNAIKHKNEHTALFNFSE